MQEQLWLPMESDGHAQRRRLWEQIPERDRTEFLARCASLIARAARIGAAPQPERQAEACHETIDD